MIEKPYVPEGLTPEGRIMASKLNPANRVNKKQDDIQFTKISFNVPKKLLKEFETIAYLNHYSRVEAFKEAMRQFIVEQTPEDYTNAEDIKNYWGQMMDAIIELSNDPKYQKLGIDPNNLLTTSAPTPTEIEKKILRKNRG